MALERSIIDGVPMPIPGRYSVEISVCQEMAWTYEDLMNTPADMVDEIIVRMSAQSKAERTRQNTEEQKRRSKGKR